MPNDTSFAIMYKKLVDHNFDPDPQQLARSRSYLVTQLSVHGPPDRANRLWTQTKKYDTIHSGKKEGEQ